MQNRPFIRHPVMLRTPRWNCALSTDLATCSEHYEGDGSEASVGAFKHPCLHPNSVMVSSISLVVCAVLSPKIIKKRVRKPVGGPLLIRSLMSVVNPIERSELSDCTLDSAMYVEIHFITALMRRGVRK